MNFRLICRILSGQNLKARDNENLLLQQAQDFLDFVDYIAV